MYSLPLLFSCNDMYFITNKTLYLHRHLVEILVTNHVNVQLRKAVSDGIQTGLMSMFIYFLFIYNIIIIIIIFILYM